MKDLIIKKLNEIESGLGVYFKATNDPTFPAEDRGVVAFKMTYEMIAFATLSDLVPEYKADPAIEFLIAKSLKNMKDLVSVQNGQIVISDEYRELIKHKEEYLKNKGNG